MVVRSAARTVTFTAVQLAAVAVAVIALRGSPRSGSDAQRQIAGASAAPFIVYTIAIVGAVLVLVAATRYGRPARRTGAAAEHPRHARRWRRIGWVMLALAIVAVGVPLLLNVLPHRSIPTPPPAGQSTPGTSVVAPTPSTTPPAATDSGPAADLLPAIVVVLPVLLILLGAGALIVARRSLANTADNSDAGPDPRSGAPASVARATGSLAHASELGLNAVNAAALEPRAAIVACYVAMEQALAETPGMAPRAADTPAEVLGRAAGNGLLNPEDAAELVELFAEARFSEHTINEAQRRAAVDALQRVLDELRSPACVSSR